MQRIDSWALLANAIVDEGLSGYVDDVSVNDIDDFLLYNVQFKNVAVSIENLLYDWGVDNSEKYVGDFIYDLCYQYGIKTLRQAWNSLKNVDFHNPRELKKATHNDGILMTIFGYLGQKGYESFDEMLDDIRN